MCVRACVRGMGGGLGQCAVHGQDKTQTVQSEIGRPFKEKNEKKRVKGGAVKGRRGRAGQRLHPNKKLFKLNLLRFSSTKGF